MKINYIERNPRKPIMRELHKRTILFLICVVVRSSFVAGAYFLGRKHTEFLKYLGLLSLVPALGFAYIFACNKRKTGVETFGKPIWWNCFRPLHSLLYLGFAVLAIASVANAYLFLAVDVVLGVVAFLMWRS